MINLLLLMNLYCKKPYNCWFVDSYVASRV